MGRSYFHMENGGVFHAREKGTALMKLTRRDCNIKHLQSLLGGRSSAHEGNAKVKWEGRLPRRKN